MIGVVIRLVKLPFRVLGTALDTLEAAEERVDDVLNRTQEKLEPVLAPFKKAVQLLLLPVRILQRIAEALS